MTTPEFTPFPKIPRLRRDMIITEKIDGTNAAVVVGEDGTVYAQSRKRFITPENDNFGFASWVHEHQDELRELGVGTHFGEWWGRGIQRGYGLDERRFSLFNVGRWNDENKPACCHVVPVLRRWTFDSFIVQVEVDKLEIEGSVAAPGFMKPEGVIVYHTAGSYLFKRLIDGDSIPKGLA